MHEQNSELTVYSFNILISVIEEQVGTPKETKKVIFLKLSLFRANNVFSGVTEEIECAETLC